MKLEAIRQQYPQYNDLSDAQLVDAMHKKYYSDMDREDFYRRVGFTDTLHVDESGQRVYDLDAAAATHSDRFSVTDPGTWPYIGAGLEWLGESAIKGGSKLLRGAASFPFDLVGADETAEAVRKFIPRVEGGGAGTDAAGTVLQYAAPASVGYKAARGAASLATASRPVQYIAGLAGAGAGDTVATVPDEAVTVGDLVGGPTDIKESDSAIVKRAKVGAETLPLGPVGDVAGGAGRRVVDAFRGTKRMNSMLGHKLREGVKETGGDPQVVAQRLNEAARRTQGPEQAGYRPTTGTASGEESLLAVERGVSAEPRMVRRSQENREALTDGALAAIETTGKPEAARSFFQREMGTRHADEALQRTQQLLKEAEQELSARVGAARSTGTGADAARASEDLDQVTRNQLKALTARKNAKFDAIDPNYEKPADQQAFDEMVETITTPASRGDIAQVPSDIRQALSAMKDEGGVTMGELSDLRPRISAAISQARANQDGALLQKLGPVMDYINHQVDELAARGDQTAAEAMDFYRREFAPKFRSAVGGRFRKAVRRDAQLPSETGRMFLAGPKEGAAQLRNIIAASPEQGMQAARDYLSSQLAMRLSVATEKNAGLATRKFMRDYSATLDQFPEVRKELGRTARELETKAKRVSGLTESVRKKQNDIKLTEREKQQQAARYFLNASPDAAVAKAFSSADSAGAMGELRRQAAKDPNALKGLRAAAKEHLRNILTNPSAGEDVAATVNRVNKAFNNEKTLGTLRKIFSPTEIARLRNVQNRLNEMASIDRRVTSNSITNQLSQDSERARILLSSMYGIVQGRGIYTITNWIGNLLRGGVTAKELANRLIQDAMLDPDLAATLLRGDTPHARRELKGYITNNYPTALADSEQDEP